MQDACGLLQILSRGKTEILAALHRIIEPLVDTVLQEQQAVGLRDEGEVATIDLHYGLRDVWDEARHVHRAKDPVHQPVAIQQNRAIAFIGEGDRVSIQRFNEAIKCALYIWIGGMTALIGSTTMKERIQSMLQNGWIVRHQIILGG